jgi:hypothetical protein
MAKKFRPTRYTGKIDQQRVTPGKSPGPNSFRKRNLAITLL